METKTIVNSVDLPNEMVNNNIEMESKTIMNFVDLPTEMVNKILSYLSYDETAKLRSVSKSHDYIVSLGV